MPHKAKDELDYPQCSLPTFLFKSPHHDLGSKIAFADAGHPDTRYMTRNQFRSWCLRFATGLRRMRRFQKGDRVLVVSESQLYIPVVIMGSICAGAIYTGIPPTSSVDELSTRLKSVGATWVIVSESAITKCVEAADDVNLPRDQIFVLGTEGFDHSASSPLSPRRADGCRPATDLIASEEDSNSFAWDELTGPEECRTTAVIAHSSGTTGPPKGIELSHYSFVVSMTQVSHEYHQFPDAPTRLKELQFLSHMPLSHMFGFTHDIVVGLAFETPVYIMGQFDLTKYLNYIEQYRISHLCTPPPLALALIKSPQTASHDLSSVRLMFMGGAVSSPQLMRDLEGVIGPQSRAINAWGMTEMNTAIMRMSLTSVGEYDGIDNIVADCEVMVMSEDGTSEITTRGPDSWGELWVRGPQIMNGYWKNPQATAARITAQGWLKTGDAGWVDDRGRFHITGRVEHVIKVGDDKTQVIPTEVEGILNQHPSIAESAVIGVLDDKQVRHLRAVIIPSAHSQSASGELTQASVQKYIEEKAPAAHRLTGGVLFVDKLPRSPAGKIWRKQLEQMSENRNWMEKAGQL